MKKTNMSGYYKDPKTGVVVNTNDDQLRSYLHGREGVREFATLKQNYEILQGELAQIKKVLGI
jgi:hypothetical protein